MAIVALTEFLVCFRYKLRAKSWHCYQSQFLETIHASVQVHIYVHVRHSGTPEHTFPHYVEA